MRQIVAVFKTMGVYRRKMLTYPFTGLRTDVQSDIGKLIFFHFGINGAGHNISGSQFGTRVVLLQKSPAIGKTEQGTFTT